MRCVDRATLKALAQMRDIGVSMMLSLNLHLENDTPISPDRGTDKAYNSLDIGGYEERVTLFFTGTDVLDRFITALITLRAEIESDGKAS